jgi:hypothetical protein
MGKPNLPPPFFSPLSSRNSISFNLYSLGYPLLPLPPHCLDQSQRILQVQQRSSHGILEPTHEKS